MWSIKITRVDNGYILEWEEDSSEPGETIYHKHVIQEDESDELFHHEGLLWQIMEYFSFGGSKHDPERIRIVRETRKVDDGNQEEETTET